MKPKLHQVIYNNIINIILTFVDTVTDLIDKPTNYERSQMDHSDEIGKLIDKPTAMEKSLVQKFKSKSVRAFCPYGTKLDCINARGSYVPCGLVHFKRIIRPHTDVKLGDCSYLDTCRHIDICKYVHYAIDDEDDNYNNSSFNYDEGLPSQWVICDLRTFDLSVLGKFSVVLADPPWDIHMDLPYGTMNDDEMKNLKINDLQDEGLIFLWVTGRAMEVGRECLEIWGYKRVDEIVWVKTNQLQRLIRTGRTGHWLNHSKEHCLIGVKGSPKIVKHLECDVIVSEVRETSRKPDELYGIIERMNPKGRYIELFARTHNRRFNWLSLGNQLPPTYVVDNELISRWNQRYPDNMLDKEKMEKEKQEYELRESENKDKKVVEAEELPTVHDNDIYDD